MMTANEVTGSIAEPEIPNYALVMGEFAWKVAHDQDRHRYPITDFVVGTMENYRALVSFKGVLFIDHVTIDRATAHGALLNSAMTVEHHKAVSEWPEADTSLYAVFPQSELPQVAELPPEAAEAMERSSYLSAAIPAGDHLLP